MSKDFDTTLSDAIDLAAAAAQPGGAAAARVRGRERTMRKRIAVSTASVILVAASATAAFKISSSHDGGPPPETANSILTTTTATDATSPSASPTTSTRASASTSPASSPPPSSPADVADPHKVVNAAWLDASQLPFADILNWKVQPATWQSLTPTVFYYANNTGLQALTVCGDPAKLLGRTIGAQGTEYDASPVHSGNMASQFVFFFSDAASAQQAFVWLQGQYGPACTLGTETVMKTAGDGLTSATWLTRKGSSGPVDLSPYNREYFVLRGSTIGYVSISSTSKLPATYDDAAQLSTIAAHLCVYGGPC